MTTESQEIHRVSHPIVRRKLEVARVLDITPRMRRITLVGEQLEGFISAAPDDHVKLVFATNETEQTALESFMSATGVPAGDAPKPVMRDYTPRYYDAEKGELEIDFVLHGDGPAATWANQAEPGQHLHLAGPRGSLIVPDIFENYLLIGDETALPAMARRLEELPASRNVQALIEIENDQEKQPLATATTLACRWIKRGQGERLLEAARQVELPQGSLYVWIACEAKLSRQIRAMLINERGIDESQVKAAGYWRLDPNEE
ncbi:siderophore-interacting protein [Pseudomonas matsuisoli]|uniref:Siderophore-interacting protein n=1 Tax=Pseudomonas matsuisoli TaxID=1515666 RepID=A0A917Q023_9PSED|nr:siderophore-interacting protein [Pseudomonas matsuisoli]GGK04416.1 siderophore-interacting protein [Pseudomonas matsuisoli]